MNKEQLEAMSDFQLSDKIHASLGGTRRNFAINNPSDMMPLVFEAGISLVSLKDGYAALNNPSYIDVDSANSMSIVDTGFYFGARSSGHANGLRAAAIVYLLMRGE